jgi:AsnC-type helix-turn-helix domain
MSKILELDEVDKKILAILMRNAKTPYTDISCIKRNCPCQNGQVGENGHRDGCNIVY